MLKRAVALQVEESRPPRAILATIRKRESLYLLQYCSNRAFNQNDATFS